MALTQKKIRLKRFMRFLGLVLAALFLMFAYWYLSNQEPKYIRKLTQTRIDIPPQFLGEILGGQNGTLSKPLDVAANSSGKIYITDSGHDRIQVFSSTGSPLFTFGKSGKANGHFNFPNAIAIDDEDNVYVAEFKNNRIQVFDSKGKYLRTITSPNKALFEPLAMTFGNDKSLYVASRTGAIIIMSKTGKLIATFGTNGADVGQLSYPNGIDVDRHGNIIVSDSGNARIQIFDKKGQVLKLLQQPQFKVSVPRGVTVDDKDRLYVVDIFQHKVVVYDKDYKYLFEIGGRGLEKDKGKFNFPNGIGWKDDKVYITDRENNRVQVFNY